LVPLRLSISVQQKLKNRVLYFLHEGNFGGAVNVVPFVLAVTLFPSFGHSDRHSFRGSVTV
jgi:hypothetical protein